MKKLFAILGVAMLVASCGTAERQFYFDSVENRTYNDPNAEFDTLSYAVGMNMGLGMVFHPAGNIFDINLIAEKFNEEISKSVVDDEFLKENYNYLTKFYKEKLNQYIMAKRFAGKDANTAFLPSLFDNGEFTVEKVSMSYGYDMANHVRKGCYPLNIHWFMKALEDAKTIEEQSAVDDFMAISTMDFRRTMSNYVNAAYPAYMAQRSADWLEMVAQQKDVNAMTVDGQTLYYRVDVAGNGVKPRSLKDTVSFSYDVYTQRGELVESLGERVTKLREALDAAIADTTMNKDLNARRIETLQKQLEQNENLSVVLERAMIKGSQYGMQKVGEGGEITLWIPASLAYGDKGNKLVTPNEGIVMCIHLKKVAFGPTEEEIEAQKALKKGVPMNPNGMPQITPSTKLKPLHKSDESGKGVPTRMSVVKTPKSETEK